MDIEIDNATSHTMRNKIDAITNLLDSNPRYNGYHDFIIKSVWNRPLKEEEIEKGSLSKYKAASLGLVYGNLINDKLSMRNRD